MATTTLPLICPQGHGPGVPGAGFCTACGTQLVPPLPAVQPMAAPQANVGPTGANVPWTPVTTASTVPAPANVPWTPVPTAPVPTVMPGMPAGVAPMAAPVAPSKNAPVVCNVCGIDGAGLDAETIVCTKCSWLRPLLPGYKLEPSVFLWSGDGKAMATLQSMPPLHAVVKAVSDKVGRPWIESTFNAIRLGPRQLPDVWKQAVLAARILGLPRMPDVYISGDQMWNTYTYGTETSSFIVLGTSHLINFANDEMLFVLAREMGHCRAGHALWKTVTRFLAGDISVQHGLLSDGLLNAISPSKLIHGALDLPLMAWARQSEITADRAGLLAVGDEALARRVLLAWSVRSARLLQQVNIEEWMKQEEASDDQVTRFSEMTTSSSMYTTRRLHLLSQAANEPGLMRWSQGIQPVRKKLAPVPAQVAGMGVGTIKVPKAAGPATAPQTKVGPPAAAAAQAKPAQAPTDSIRAICTKCKTGVRIPLAVLKDKTSLNVRCPQCQNVFTIRRKEAALPTVATGAGQVRASPAATGAKPVPPPAATAGLKPATTPPAGGDSKSAKAMPATAGAKHATVQATARPAAAGAK